MEINREVSVTSNSQKKIIEREVLSSQKGPAFCTRKKSIKAPECPTCPSAPQDSQILFLREVPMGGARGGIGYVIVPLASSEVREFKKEMKNLLTDPVGLAEQFDQFLGPNIYTWREMQCILQALFTVEERKMIRAAGVNIWDRENNTNQGPIGEHKLPITDPNWNRNSEEGRRHMTDYRNLIVKGIKEAVPRVNNVKKAFCGEQEKDESPTAWMTRLRNNIQLYSEIDLESEGGKTMLKVHFVLHSWPDIRRKLEKLEKWPERGLDELLEEAQKVYVRRDEKRMKTKAKVTLSMGNNPFFNASLQKKTSKGSPHQSTSETSGPRKIICTYCNKEGHGHWRCFKRLRDQEAFQMEGQVLNN
ncbi:uncharacterized protein LOC116445870 [Corvus moneduloides]|uniref:Core shell protein Gag P30 domain-containing protein n=1 Tax=Corvus moneduloides TaxID=1196302 RepID=A0A8U7MU99_CORMO|nr:uncharacterized protein LOC116445870 [Corvus moneduloides]XP_031968856.1 uncharacterized protein LOC116445870 [Corvus moneduloides]XP_031968858.1 uncharacterized protein LOC116445870 [Corvus moneduloides]XP_031968859.1 uncharacterized protein LOC116445870 [Corvus moneduloides]